MLFCLKVWSKFSKTITNLQSSYQCWIRKLIWVCQGATQTIYFAILEMGFYCSMAYAEVKFTLHQPYDRIMLHCSLALSGYIYVYSICPLIPVTGFTSGFSWETLLAFKFYIIHKSTRLSTTVHLKICHLALKVHLLPYL